MTQRGLILRVGDLMVMVLEGSRTISTRKFENIAKSPLANPPPHRVRALWCVGPPAAGSSSEPVLLLFNQASPVAFTSCT